jgi:plasmid stabilization system protein ParE
MTRRRLEFHPAAVEDALAARDWYADRSSAARGAFLGELGRAFDVIETEPEMFPPYVHGTRRYVLRRFPYSVVYRLHADVLQVVAVAHAKRRPGYWKDR